MRRLLALAAVAAVGAVGLIVTTDEPAEAHGAQVFPGSRQYHCYVDGLTPSGQVDPSNPACIDAVAANGTAWYYNWFGNLDSNGAGRTVGYVPDGQICDGGGRGPYDFSAFNAARADWPRTHVTAGATYQFQHNNWAHHPGHFDIYLTRQGFNPESPLTWADLELIDTVQDPPQSGGPGGMEYYYWDTTLPSDRTGQHIIFTHWVRSDSAENFYSCSDVVFDGGNGEVDYGPGDGGTIDPPPPACPDAAPGAPANIGASAITQTSAHIMWGLGVGGCVTGYDLLDASGEVIDSTDGSPMVDVTDLEPGTEYTFQARSRNDNTGDVSSTVSVTFSTLSEDDDDDNGGGPGPIEPGACTAEITVVNTWAGGYQADLTVTAGDQAISGWAVTVSGASVSQAWNAEVSGDVFTNVSWNGSLAAGASTSAGFLGSGDPGSLSADCSA